MGIEMMDGYTGDAVLTRGMNLTRGEVAQMKKMKTFYWPSFTSASKGSGFSGNTKILIDARRCERITLDIDSSPYNLSEYKSEREVLIQSYAKFKFIKSHTDQNGKHEIHLKLLDPMCEHGEMIDLYHKAKHGRWSEVFMTINGQKHKALTMTRYWKPTSGWTMLHQAAYWGNQEAASHLVKLGADEMREAWFPHNALLASHVTNKHGKPIEWTQVLAARTQSPF